MNTKKELDDAALIVAKLVGYETPVTASLGVTIANTGTTWKYTITAGDICDRGSWKWVCAFGDTLDQCADSASVQCAAQADKRALEIRDLTNRALELGLVVTEAEGAK